MLQHISPALGTKRRPDSLARRIMPNRRLGAILIVAMICLLLVTMLLGSLLKLAVDQRKQLRFEEQYLQAGWLAESAVERAASRLSANGDYEGETWKIAAEELGGQFSAEIKIIVRKPESEPDRRIVTVEAVYPSNSIRVTKQTRQVAVDLQAKI